MNKLNSVLVVIENLFPYLFHLLEVSIHLAPGPFKASDVGSSSFDASSMSVCTCFLFLFSLPLIKTHPDNQNIASHLKVSCLATFNSSLSYNLIYSLGVEIRTWIGKQNTAVNFTYSSGSSPSKHGLWHPNQFNSPTQEWALGRQEGFTKPLLASCTSAHPITGEWEGCWSFSLSQSHDSPLLLPRGKTKPAESLGK